MFKESYYIGSSKRRNGSRLSKIDPSIPKRYDQISEKRGSANHTYFVCNNIVRDNIKCDFCVRRDIYLKDPDKYDSHKCMSLQIERFFEPDQRPEEITIEQITSKVIEFIGQNKLPLNLTTTFTFRELCLSR